MDINPFTMIRKILISPFIDNDFSKILIEYLKSEFPDLKISIKKSGISEKC